MSTCPECGEVTPCPVCADASERWLTRLADPHRAVGFLDGDVPCTVSGLFIEEHALVNGRSVCTRDDA